MKRSAVRTCMGVIFAAGLALVTATPSHAAGACSAARAAGNWSFTDNGTVLGIGLRSAVGVFTFVADDGSNSGTVIGGAAMASLNGAVAAETFAGTYSVNADCTGTVHVVISDAATSAQIFTLDMYMSFANDMKELHGLFTSVVVPNGASLPTVILLTANKQ